MRCITLVLLLLCGSCGVLAPGGAERIAQDSAQFAPIVERAKQDIIQGVPWWQRSGELLIGLTTALGGAAGIAGTRLLRGPADRRAKVKAAAARVAQA